MNIHSHLFGALLFALLLVTVDSTHLTEHETASLADRLVFAIFLSAAVFCLGSSAFYHTCCVHSHRVLSFYDPKFGPPKRYMLHASRFARNRFVEGRAALQRTSRQSERLSRGVPAKPARSAGNAFRFAVRTVTRYRTSPKFVSRGGVTRYEHRVVKLQ